MEVHRSALKHGITAADAEHAASRPVTTIDLEEDSPARQLRLGFDTTGRLLETVVLTFDDERQLVIHAMKARKTYLNLLPGKEQTQR